MGSLGWAVGLSVLSAASYALAAVAQEQLAKHRYRGVARWCAALVLTACGVTLHVLALNFGTVAVVQALGTLTLLFALPVSVLRYQVRIEAAAWVDAAITVLGLAVILSLSVRADDPAVLSMPEVRYLSLCAVLVALTLGVSAWFAGPRTRAVLFAGAAGVAFGVASVQSKAVMATFTTHGSASVAVFAGSMVALFSVTGYVLGQLSYRGAGLAAPLATVSVANPVVAAVVGVVLFDESVRFGRTGLAVVAIAALATTLGIIGLARRTAQTGPADDDPAQSRNAGVVSPR